MGARNVVRSTTIPHANLSSPSPVALTHGVYGAYRTSRPLTIRVRRVPGTINGLRKDALPDTGADASFISAAFLATLQHRGGGDAENIEVSPIPTGAGIITPTIQLASGKTVKPNATASVPWRFEGDPRIYRLACYVLPKCAHDVILGDGFLRATETLTRFTTRITVTLRALGRSLMGLNYMGAHGSDETKAKRRLWGYLDGEGVAALADLGSDIMVVSGAYARRRGFQVCREKAGRVQLEFADGSTAWTDGIVGGLEWDFGGMGEKVASDFYVLEDLPVDVALSGDFVFHHDVFGKHDESFRYGGSLGPPRLCNIKLLGRPAKPEQGQGLVDGKCQSSSWCRTPLTHLSDIPRLIHPPNGPTGARSA